MEGQTVNAMAETTQPKQTITSKTSESHRKSKRGRRLENRKILRGRLTASTNQKGEPVFMLQAVRLIQGEEWRKEDRLNELFVGYVNKDIKMVIDEVIHP